MCSCNWFYSYCELNESRFVTRLCLKVGYRLLCEANTILMELKWIYILKNDIKEDCFT